MKGIGTRLAVPVSTLLAGLVIGGVGTSFAAGSFQGFPTASVVVNGKAISSDVPAFVIADRTVLPVRAISEALGLDVKWDQASNTVVLTSKTATTGEAVTFGNLTIGKPIAGRTTVIGEVTNVSSTAVSGIAAIAFYDASGKLLGRGSGVFPTVARGQTKTFQVIADSDMSGFATMRAEVEMIIKE